MKTTYRYLRFVEVPSSGKTKKWSCQNINSGVELGVVRWCGPWRQFCYFPSVQAVYSAGCLRDIGDFLKEADADRRMWSGG